MKRFSASQIGTRQRYAWHAYRYSTRDLESQQNQCGEEEFQLYYVKGTHTAR